MEIIHKTVTLLRAHFSKEEMIQLGEALDGGAGDLLLDQVNEVLEEIAPEVFGDEVGGTDWNAVDSDY